MGRTLNPPPQPDFELPEGVRTPPVGERMEKILDRMAAIREERLARWEAAQDTDGDDEGDGEDLGGGDAFLATFPNRPSLTDHPGGTARPDRDSVQPTGPSEVEMDRAPAGDLPDLADVVGTLGTQVDIELQMGRAFLNSDRDVDWFFGL